ncbi:peroxisomal carnitine O-octanoyltransferase-like isoform X2 [Lytechinus variegatus]|uniref:peroxisomal carnitine O-octanoyltransferase-like isoform X2 n=1 Tax=Lytechinus variegatus TaxID=7654 RepID=UPI001BB16FED|nr:peroxisomal carnitine O-octanoyltransferase-like isoform X2 [Lytechinus variegatus]
MKKSCDSYEFHCSLVHTSAMDSRSSTQRERTFQYDEDLPSLPVPPLQQTLHKYLQSVKPFLTEEELQETERIVGEFGHGVGKTLHAKLEERASRTKNWLEEWWEEKAYLETRLPLGVLQNPSGPIPAQDSMWPPREGSQLERGAICLWYLLSFYQLIRKEMIPVDKNRAGTQIFSMDQLRGLFHSCREPGLERDTLFRNFKTEREGPCPTHVHVMCNGHIFKMTVFDRNGQLLTSSEILRQMSYIKELSKEKGQCIGALTADDRPTYAKAFEHLVSLDPANRAHIETIKSSIVGCIIDDGHPQTMAQTCAHGIAGPSPHNRWFDKGYSTIITANGCACSNIDHAPFDGMVVVVLSMFIHQKMLKDGGDMPGKHTVRPDIPMPIEMIFTVDQKVQDDIEHATETYQKSASNFDVLCSSYNQFGKDFLKKHKMHPDATIQLALQLAYYTATGKPGAAYETATTRQFYHGRTDTMRSCTMEAIDWCKAMLDSQAESSHQLSLLRRAHDKHNTLMTEAASGQGIDRHLLGLYILSQELGLPVPDLFTDKAYTLSGGGGNFTLSTSTLGYTPILGSIAPMRNDGYMCCYRIGKDELQFTVSAFKNCAETDAHLFFREITLALNKIGNLLLNAKL